MQTQASLSGPGVIMGETVTSSRSEPVPARLLPVAKSSIGLQLAFAFYTAGFYVYSILVFFGMEPFLKGFLVYAAAICLPLLVWPYLKVLVSGAPGKAVDFMLWLMLAYMWTWMASVGAEESNPVEFRNYLGAIISWAMLFMLGRLIPIYDKRVPTLAVAVYVLMLVLMLANTEAGTFTPAQSPDTFATYQAYAVILCVVTFTLLYHLPGDLQFWVIALASIVSMAILGSRSELVGLLVLGAFVANLRKPNAKLIALQAFAALVLYLVYVVLTSGEWNRFVNLVEENAESTFSGRAEATQEALKVILNSPVTGGFGKYEEGLYAHNLLSVWVDFGLFGITLYVTLLATALVGLLRTPLREARTVVALGIWIFSALLVTFVKAGEYYLVPFAMGMLASHRSIFGPRVQKPAAPRSSLPDVGR